MYEKLGRLGLSEMRAVGKDLDNSEEKSWHKAGLSLEDTREERLRMLFCQRAWIEKGKEYMNM